MRPAPAVPLCRDRIAAAEPSIRELVACLRVPLPVPAQGVAAATVLLTDATGPLYHRRSHAALDDLLREAIAQLDPARPLLPGGLGRRTPAGGSWPAMARVMACRIHQVAYVANV